MADVIASIQTRKKTLRNRGDVNLSETGAIRVEYHPFVVARHVRMQVVVLRAAAGGDAVAEDARLASANRADENGFAVNLVTIGHEIATALRDGNVSPNVLRFENHPRLRRPAAKLNDAATLHAVGVKGMERNNHGIGVADPARVSGGRG